MANQRKQSVEPQIADLCNGWMRAMNLDYKLQQESLNDEIDLALSEYESKSGGAGGNRPDAKLLLKDNSLKYWPILIEYKGNKGELVKLDGDGNVANRDKKGKTHYNNIKKYAINGAIHYANALLHYTSYSNIIAIGVTGYKDAKGTLQHEIAAYYVSKDNLGVGQLIGHYDDFSFMKYDHFNDFIETVNELTLTPEEIELIKSKRETEIQISLKRLNEDIYANEKGISESDRVYLVAASIIATLGIPNRIKPLEKSQLLSSTEPKERDGDIILRKVDAFLSAKTIPQEKTRAITNTLGNVLLDERINQPENGVSQLRRIFNKVVDDLGIYYKIGLTTDFTGRLFNEMYSWLGFTQDKLNDVVLTPSYVATLLVKLARVNKDSYVWDFATGSAGLLVAAMNEMLSDAKQRISSPEKLAQKTAQIKAKQLLGIEILQNVYMLAVLNMILMGDGSSNILNMDSLRAFDGTYQYGAPQSEFPANAFVLNPPYSADGNGMIFVQKALSMMHSGYAAVIIQGSAGSGKAASFNQKILEHSTLLASIKMPVDLFVGKSNVQTYVYVFRIGERHHADDIVRFIDFSYDGYSRSNRRKAAINLRNIDNAPERYAELVDVVHYGPKKLDFIDSSNYYEGTVDPDDGSDWNQSAPVDLTPKLDDFTTSVRDFLTWEITTLLKQYKAEDDSLGK